MLPTLFSLYFHFVFILLFAIVRPLFFPVFSPLLARPAWPLAIPQGLREIG
jgi:hypothetical protein